MTHQSAEEDGTVDAAAYLRARCSEPVPEWLRNFPTANYHDYRPTRAKDFDLRPFFQSRVVYYPGSGTDGHAVRLFGSAHTAHCFFYLDYYPRTNAFRSANSPQIGFRGYHCVAAVSIFDYYNSYYRLHSAENWLSRETRITESTIPEVRSVTLSHIEFDLGIKSTRQDPDSFLSLYILDRDSDYGDDHGVERFAWLVGNLDAVTNYRCFASQASMNPRSPYAMLLQDHGLGGNYDRFGQGHLMERIANEIGCHPEWILFGIGAAPIWPHYQEISEVRHEKGGEGRSLRGLYRRIPESETTPAVS